MSWMYLRAREEIQSGKKLYGRELRDLLFSIAKTHEVMFISSFNPCMHIPVNDVTTNLSDRFRSEGSISVSEPKALCNRAI